MLNSIHYSNKTAIVQLSLSPSPSLTNTHKHLQLPNADYPALSFPATGLSSSPPCVPKFSLPPPLLLLLPSHIASVSHHFRRDQTLVAQAIKRYMNQYSIPQREVVEKTGLNQSHLSQHFLHGVTMKRAKRIKLYHWFEEDQKARTGSKFHLVGQDNYSTGLIGQVVEQFHTNSSVLFLR